MQAYWSWLPFPTPGDLPNPGIELHLSHLLHFQADSLPLSHLGSPLQRILIKYILIVISENMIGTAFFLKVLNYHTPILNLKEIKRYPRGT